ncbi:MAG: lipoate--protein ligase family protein [Planctomycetes bacterium]|nr:lipoate--protein ligase family protein [Planctomycetota bacterium]
MVAHRLIIDRPASGAWNMAVDETLLIDAAVRGIATLRLYQWSEPTLSLGYFQQYGDRNQHLASRECVCVRRQTGGGAILHDRELTYSLALPANHPLARQTESLYASVHDAFIAALKPMLGGEDSRWILLRRDQESTMSAHEEPFLCFQRRARGDVVFRSRETSIDPGDNAARTASPDWKVLGSAQRRHQGAILQHGSLLWNTSLAAPELAGLSESVGIDASTDELSTAISEAILRKLSLHMSQAELPPDLESNARQLANNKYASAAWTKRR